MEKSKNPKGMLKTVKSNGSTRSLRYIIKLTCQSSSKPKSPRHAIGNHKRFILIAEAGDWLERRSESIGNDERRYITASLALGERERIAVDKARGILIEKAEADRARLAIVNWAVGIFDRAGSELAPQVAGKPARKVKQIVTDYFNQIRDETIERHHRLTRGTSK